jgi:hypothetical protein
MSNPRLNLITICLCAVLLSACAVLLAACAGGPQRRGSEESSFVPPTHPPPLTPLVFISPTPEPTQPTPAPALTCLDSLTFLEDLTIEDGAQVLPGSPIDKRWKVANSGDCNWDARYSLRLIAGPSLGAESPQTLYPARGGTDLVIRVEFQAPSEPGVYRSAWQAYSPDGQAFGDPFYIDIQVVEE